MNKDNVIISRPDDGDKWIIDLPEIREGIGRTKTECKTWKQLINVLAHWYSIHDYNPQCLLCKGKKK